MSKPQALNVDLNKLRKDATERYHKAVDEALERDILEGLRTFLRYGARTRNEVLNRLVGLLIAFMKRGLWSPVDVLALLKELHEGELRFIRSKAQERRLQRTRVSLEADPTFQTMEHLLGDLELSIIVKRRLLGDKTLTYYERTRLLEFSAKVLPEYQLVKLCEGALGLLAIERGI